MSAHNSLFQFRRKRGPIARLNEATAQLTTFAERLEAENLRMIDAIQEDENRVRIWKLTVIGTDGERHVVPLKCSRKQVRKIKLALFDADADALAVER